ncbi:DUF2007 domain-containing protein [Leptobacterium flavescens]|uniref:DUF2007 domain-containing protein n=1 Tax=Leptobacterium flavescens TaxID=472055 RepID=A0A6P0UP04_9FLAO|nr:DUF2007 domain-containing protein [Leptobacterium flavescens]NER14222.1 DUF2007 domain-containing protein [Leptobacterium flavescens]
MENFIVVATFTYPFEYAVLKLILEEEGIPYVFENETMVAITPFYSNALGGIKLKVHRKDAKATIEIIKDLGQKNSNLRIV